jgi:hypothetical protein
MLSDYYNAEAFYLLRYNAVDMYQRFGGNASFVCNLKMEETDSSKKMSKCLPEFDIYISVHHNIIYENDQQDANV